MARNDDSGFRPSEIEIFDEFTKVVRDATQAGLDADLPDPEDIPALDFNEDPLPPEFSVPDPVDPEPDDEEDGEVE